MMNKARILCALFLYLSFNLSNGYAAVITMAWEGRLTVLDTFGIPIVDSMYAGFFDPNDPGAQAPISGTLSFDTLDPVNSASMTIDPFSYVGNNADLYDINFTITSDPNGSGRFYAIGNMLGDFGLSTDIPISLVWDIQGLVNAILNPDGLQLGDIIIDNQLIRNGTVLVSDLDSAIPASDGTSIFGLISGNHILSQGPTPMASTTWDTTPLCFAVVNGDCLGLNPSGDFPLVDDAIGGSPMIDGPFSGLSVNIDVGSGGMQVVPIPPALYLFGIGALGLIGMSRRKKIS
jgi:hypothetical protein